MLALRSRPRQVVIRYPHCKRSPGPTYIYPDTSLSSATPAHRRQAAAFTAAIRIHSGIPAASASAAASALAASASTAPPPASPSPLPAGRRRARRLGRWRQPLRRGRSFAPAIAAGPAPGLVSGGLRARAEEPPRRPSAAHAAPVRPLGERRSVAERRRASGSSGAGTSSCHARLSFCNARRRNCRPLLAEALWRRPVAGVAVPAARSP